MWWWKAWRVSVGRGEELTCLSNRSTRASYLCAGRSFSSDKLGVYQSVEMRGAGSWTGATRPRDELSYQAHVCVVQGLAAIAWLVVGPDVQHG